MKKTCASFLLVALSSTAALAQESRSPAEKNDDSPGFCPVPPVSFSSKKLMPAGEVKVEANRAEIIEREVALFSGNVDITSDSATIRADQAQINNNGQQLYAKGDVEYADKQLHVASDSVDVDSKDESLTMSNTVYHLNGSNGHGDASTIALNTQDGLVLRDVSFTTCPEGEEEWLIRASEISIRRGKAWGEAKHTRFYLGNVPVFYLPYFAFPITNQRQTGFLFPKVSNSSNTGVDYEQPFYWNMAPNYDMTLSPRVMSARGVQLKTEFRHMSAASYSQLNMEYLPQDNDMAENPDRYFYRVFHEGNFADNWTASVNVNGLSDDNYIVDLGSDFYNRADTHLFRTGSVSYSSDEVLFSVNVRDFEIIGDYTDTYRALPEAKLNYVHPLARYLEFRLDSELAWFDNTSPDAPTAMRFHAAPTLAIPFQRQWGEFSAEASMLNTYYRQKNIEGTGLEEKVNRTLGQGKLYGALYFENDESWFSKDMSMTLEPRIQYLYTSYEDQKGIGFYDTTLWLTDVEGLFRGQEFTGLDRISDNTQVTVALTSRLLDKTNREQFVLSVGQIFYLDENKVIAATKEGDRSALAAELDWRVNDEWFFHTDFQIATETDKVERASTTFEYRESSSKLIQLTHRYVRELSGETIDQVGLSAAWPLSDRWQLVGRTYRDSDLNRSVENYFGVQYESCCWAIQIVAQRQLSNRYAADGAQSVDEFDSGISMQFIFKGMGSGSTGNNMLSNGLFGYRQPYSLN